MAVLGSTTLTGCNSIPDFISAGSNALFYNTAAPTSWTKSTAHDNKALRVVSGNGGGSGGSSTFSSVFNGNVDNTTLTTGQLARHAHRPLDAALVQSWGVSNGTGAFSAAYAGATTVNNSPNTGETGSTEPHTHGINVQYIDLILCTKN